FKSTPAAKIVRAPVSTTTATSTRRLISLAADSNPPISLKLRALALPSRSKRTVATAPSKAVSTPIIKPPRTLYLRSNVENRFDILLSMLHIWFQIGRAHFCRLIRVGGGPGGI